jgi:hypothetical protein
VLMLSISILLLLIVAPPVSVTAGIEIHLLGSQPLRKGILRLSA